MVRGIPLYYTFPPLTGHCPVKYLIFIDRLRRLQPITSFVGNTDLHSLLEALRIALFA